MLSFIATLTTAIVLFAAGRRESNSRFIALLGPAIFLAGYRPTGGWYELARVDALFGALSLAGVAVAIHGRGREWGPSTAGLLLGLAFMTKQNGLLLAAVTAAYLAWAIGLAVWRYLASFAVVGLLPILWLHLSTGGWFSTYVFGIAYASPLEPIRVPATLGLELGGAMGPLVAGWLIATAAAWRRNGWRGLLARPWPLFIAVAVLISVAGRASTGGNRNNLMPAYTFLCLAPTLVVAEVPWRPGVTPRLVERWLAAGVLLQFGLTLFNPIRFALGLPGDGRFMPTADMRAAGDSLVERISAIEGEVLVMMHPYYALRAGKEPAAHIQMLWHARWRGREPLPAELVARLENGYYAAIISDESDFFEREPALGELLARTYRPAETLAPAQSPPTLSGLIVRPVLVYRPR
jgi:hypothetical protein